jgi:hypothetical protein
MEDSTEHDAVAAFCLLVVFNLWRPYLMIFVFSCLFTSLLRSATLLRFLYEGL